MKTCQENCVSLKHNKYLVTGGAGFIGSHLCENILKQDKEVICLDNLSFGKKENIIHLIGNPKFKFIQADICNLSDISEYFAGIDVVFHNAASKFVFCKKNPRQDFLVNIQGAWNVFEACRLSDVKMIIHASTGSVYGEAIAPQDETHCYNPISFYGVSKLAGERYLAAFRNYYELNYVILRYSHVFGPRQESADYGGVIPIFIRRALANEPLIIYGDGEQIRHFTYVTDIIKANFLLTTSCITGEAYNVASEINLSIYALANKIIELTNSTSKLIFTQKRQGDIYNFNVNNKKIRNMGMEFSEFEPCLIETIQWYKKLRMASG